MLRRAIIVLWAIAVLTMITVTVATAGPGSSSVRNPGSHQQIGKPKFEDMKLKTGMGQSAPGPRGGGSVPRAADAGGFSATPSAVRPECDRRSPRHRRPPAQPN